MASEDRTDELQTMLEIRDFLQDIVAGSEITENSKTAAAEFVASLDAKFAAAWHSGDPGKVVASFWPTNVIEQALHLREFFATHGLSAEWARVGGLLAISGFVVGSPGPDGEESTGAPPDEEAVGKEAVRLLDLWTETEGAEEQAPYRDTMALLGKPNGAGWIWAREVRRERDVDAEIERSRKLALEAIGAAEAEADRLRTLLADTAWTEDERHAVAHARHLAEQATDDRPECCFDHEVVKAILRVVDRSPPRARVSVLPMPLSDGRTDYFVSIRVGDKDVTPHVFREEYKAAYHVALYDWLLNGTGEEPCPVDFGPDDWPARTTPAPADPAADAGTPAEMLDLAAEFEGEAKAHGALGDKDERKKCLRAAYALRHLAAMQATHGTRTLHDPFLGRDVKIPDGLLDRLNGRYAVGPMMPNGQPEFGWREFEVPPIHKEAAAVIENLLGIRKEPTSN